MPSAGPVRTGPVRTGPASLPIPSFSIVVPTIGRKSLVETLASIAAQALVCDEVIVVGDGPHPEARGICEDASEAMAIAYSEVPFEGAWGARPRTVGLGRATGSHVLMIDDDDVFTPGAFAAIRREIESHPDRPLMFKVDTRYGLLWREPRVSHGNVGTGMLVLPNVPERMGVWGSRYAGDYDFIKSTEALWKDQSRPEGFVWVPETIVRARVSWADVSAREASGGPW